MAKESGKYIIFITLGYRSSSPLGYYYPCKETRLEKHAWAPLNCFMLELIITSITTRIPSPLLINN
jgi:hypothetical protein